MEFCVRTAHVCRGKNEETLPVRHQAWFTEALTLDRLVQEQADPHE